jgi:hypothetical protein
MFTVSYVISQNGCRFPKGNRVFPLRDFLNAAIGSKGGLNFVGAFGVEKVACLRKNLQTWQQDLSAQHVDLPGKENLEFPK